MNFRKVDSTLRLTEIRERDRAYGPSVPDHWSAIRDRRYLLGYVDEQSRIIAELTAHNDCSRAPSESDKS